MPLSHGRGDRLLLCRDRECAAPVYSIDTPATSARPPEDLEPGVWFWQLRDLVHGGIGCEKSPIWEFTVRPRDTLVDTSWRPAFDDNRDGFGDLAAIGQTYGAALVLQGGATQLGSPVLAFSGPTSQLDPSAVEYAGDVNGDGFGDLLVTGDSGAWFLQFGDETGLSAGHIQGVGRDVDYVGAGDIDGDGYADVVTVGTDSGVGVRRGGPGGLTSALLSSGVHGHAAAGLDVNGDGFGDVIVGDAAGPGGIVVLLGGTSGLQSMAAVGCPFIGARDAVPLNAGDVDGDGYADVLVSSSGASSVTNWIVRGGPNPGSYSGTLFQPPEAIDASSFMDAADIDDDGFSDLVVLSRSLDHTEQTVSIHLGGIGMWGALPSSTFLSPATEIDGRGAALAVRDFDGDGHGDIVIAGQSSPTAPALWYCPGGSLPATLIPLPRGTLFWNHPGPGLAQ